MALCLALGELDGTVLGMMEGLCEGFDEGLEDGIELGLPLGPALGCGDKVGTIPVGEALGSGEGALDVVVHVGQPIRFDRDMNRKVVSAQCAGQIRSMLRAGSSNPLDSSSHAP